MSELNDTVARITDQFFMNFVRRGDVGAALSIWMGSTEIINFYEGFVDDERTNLWEEDTMATVNSAINGPIAATVLLALHKAGLSPESPIGSIWPELAQGDLTNYTLGHLLSQQCGILGLDHAEGDDHDSIVDALNRQSTKWLPGEKHGFQVGTFPFIADELVRRSVKKTLPQYWRDCIGDILGLDVWIGDEYPRDALIAAPLHIRGPVDSGSSAAFEAFNENDSLTSKGYRLSCEGVRNDNHHPEFPLPKVSGVASAKGLARFYTLMASGGEWSGFQLVPTEVCAWAEELLVEGEDQVLKTTTAFSAGFMKDPVASHCGKIHLFNSSPLAFGFPGEGGTFAFGDPGTEFGFAYVANQMDRSLLPAEKALCLSRPFYEF